MQNVTENEENKSNAFFAPVNCTENPTIHIIDTSVSLSLLGILSF